MAEGSPFVAREVLAAWDETPQLRGVRLVLGNRVPDAATAPRAGQVLKLRAEVAGADGLPALAEGYYALSSVREPGTGELLLKRGSALADTLIASARPGALLEAEGPLGPGFPIERARGKDVLLLAAGSGIAPIRALLEELLFDRANHGRIDLFYGQRTQEELAYLAEHDRWRARGVSLWLCLTQPTADWRGHPGRITDVLEREWLSALSADVVIFFAGMTAMVVEARRVLALRGLDRAHGNF